MSISLNDHENRIKILEARKINKTLIWSGDVVKPGPKRLLDDPYKYDIIEILYGDDITDNGILMMTSSGLKECNGYCSLVSVENDGGQNVNEAIIQGCSIRITSTEIETIFPYIEISSVNGILMRHIDNYTTPFKMYGITWGGISLRHFLRKSINWLNSYFHFLKMEVK